MVSSLAIAKGYLEEVFLVEAGKLDIKGNVTPTNPVFLLDVQTQERTRDFEFSSVVNFGGV